MKSSLLVERKQLEDEVLQAENDYISDRSEERKNNLLDSMRKLVDFISTTNTHNNRKNNILSLDEGIQLAKQKRDLNNKILFVKNFDNLIYSENNQFFDVLKNINSIVAETIDHLDYPQEDAGQLDLFDSIRKLKTVANELPDQSFPFVDVLREETLHFYESLIDYANEDERFQEFCQEDVGCHEEDFWQELATKVRALRQEQELTQESVVSRD